MRYPFRVQRIWRTGWLCYGSAYLYRKQTDGCSKTSKEFSRSRLYLQTDCGLLQWSLSKGRDDYDCREKCFCVRFSYAVPGNRLGIFKASCQQFAYHAGSFLCCNWWEIFLWNSGKKGRGEFRHRRLYSYPGKYRKSKQGK